MLGKSNKTFTQFLPDSKYEYLVTVINFPCYIGALADLLVSSYNDIDLLATAIGLTCFFASISTSK